MNNSIGVLLTSFKRPHTLRPQLAAIDAQTVKPAEVVIWHNDGGVQPDVEAMRGRKVVALNYNSGVWARFSAALNLFNTEFICVFDDDTIPGVKWLENCLGEHAKEHALYGALGVKFPTGDRSPRYYFNTTPERHVTVEADIVGHAWFMSRDLLQAACGFVSCSNLMTAGEDYHLAFAAQQHRLRCLVPPRWSPDLCGSTQAWLGDDDVALFKQEGEDDKKATAHRFYRRMGWEPLAIRKPDAVHA